MSSFSRGFARLFHRHSLRLPCSIRTTVFSTRPQLFALRADTRFFSSPTSRQYANPSAFRSRPRRNLMSSDPVLRTIEATKKPILLYQAPTRRFYNITVYGFALSLVGSALFLLRWRYELPKDLSFFVGPTYVVVAIIMLGIAGYIFSAPVSRCSSIEIVPVLRGPLQLRVKARIAPFLSEQIIESNIGDATLSEKTSQIVAELREAERARTQDINQGLEGMFITQRFWEWLARFMEQKWNSFFLRFKFAVLRFGTVSITVEDRKWKIDCSGYMLEDGRAIDRLISTD
ncbi:hypothetical protein CC78DRAFT_533193 [Lojkania enalia]|uniref:Uncharacterized protein n=1 Tax=Lojkania enalia TaxID=147567 RepID=A0A9P4N3C5_9PLEO|nr:hypothetical protein CC78DRAFT_533193 [Didymosphaeria enalia]